MELPIQCMFRQWMCTGWWLGLAGLGIWYLQNILYTSERITICIKKEAHNLCELLYFLLTSVLLLIQHQWHYQHQQFFILTKVGWFDNAGFSRS